jgi:hypothetical protein
MVIMLPPPPFAGGLTLLRLDRIAHAGASVSYHLLIIGQHARPQDLLACQELGF